MKHMLLEACAERMSCMGTASWSHSQHEADATIFLLRPKRTKKKKRKIMCSARKFVLISVVYRRNLHWRVSMLRRSTHKNKHNIASFIKCVLGEHG